MENLPVKFPVFEPGSVWLVGAGPGDPGLMSLAGLHALQTSDVIVYDALVGDDILKLARPEAQQEYAGKRGGKPSPKQTDITERLVELARDGKRVLRLKGGDPFVFGRGAEECFRLIEADIPFRVVPGITAGVGGLAYAGIPMTTPAVPIRPLPLSPAIMRAVMYQTTLTGRPLPMVLKHSFFTWVLHIWIGSQKS